jgi:hypothetical protein
MAKDETASKRSAEVARAYARYTINLQRAFNDLWLKLQRAAGEPASDAAATRSQLAFALVAFADFLGQIGPTSDLARHFGDQFAKLAGALEGLNRGARSPILDPASVKRNDPPTVWIARAHVALAVEIMRPVLKGREAKAKWGAQGREAAAKWAAKKHPGLKKLITESATHRSDDIKKAIISWCKDFSRRRVTDDVAAGVYSKALDNWKTCASNCNGDQIEGEADRLLQEALTLNDESLKSVDLASGG